jgi:poly-gamma-glutamate synthesis protein (capsule biosynthesis protein)
VAVPQRAHYAQVFVRLDPPDGGQKLRRLAVDNIRLVEWARKPESGRRFDTVESSNGAEVAAVADSQAAGDAPFLP